MFVGYVEDYLPLSRYLSMVERSMFVIEALLRAYHAVIDEDESPRL